ncbi:hypothetical protein AMTRI_Chr05g71990 [Amborella trichopoda]
MQKDKKATTRLAKRRTHNNTPPTQYNASGKYMHHEVRKRERNLFNKYTLSTNPSKKLLENFERKFLISPLCQKTTFFSDKSAPRFEPRMYDTECFLKL